MTKLCIPKEKIEVLKTELKKLGDDPFSSLIDMTSTERRKFFKDATGDSAGFLNTSFEKAIIKDNEDSLLRWAKENLTVTEANEVLADLPEGKLSDWDAYMESNGIYEDFVNDKLGLKLSDADVEKFTKLGRSLYEAEKKAGDDFGNLLDPESFKKTVEVGKALKELKDFQYEKMPGGAWKTFASTSGKATMLASIKTPLLNIESNSINAITEALARRLGNRTAGFELAKEKSDYVKKAYELYDKTGFDITRATDFDDTVVGVGRMLGESTAVPKNKIVRGFTDFIFDTTLSKPDVVFGGATFADSAGILSNKIAKGDKVLAREIFDDATRLRPRTKEGTLVREMSVNDARMATYTHDGKLSEISLGVKRGLNKYSSGLQLGEILMPFTKTPTNVVELGFDYSGFGIFRGLGKVISSKRTGVPLTEKEMAEIMRQAIRGGIGMTAGVSIVANIAESEFIGAYDPERQKVNQLKNTNYDAIKWGDKWVSLDYFGPLRGPIKSLLYAKKYGSDKFKKAGAYTLAMLGEATALPVVEPITSIGEQFTRIDPDNSDSWWEKTGDAAIRSVKDLVISRTVPGIVNDVAKGTDDVQRDTRTGQYKIGPVEFDQLIAKIPGLRQNLPEKTDALGRTMEEESFISTILFGSRVKTSRDDKITDEIFRLRDTGNTPSLKDLKFSRSEVVGRMKEALGEDKFRKTAEKFGNDTALAYLKTMSSSKYKNSDDETKKELLDKAQNDIYNKLTKKYRSKKKPVTRSNVLSERENRILESFRAGEITADQARELRQKWINTQ